MAVITADFGRVRSGFLMAMQPLEDGQTLCQGIVYARRTRKPLRGFAPLNLSIRRLFTFGYLADEARVCVVLDTIPRVSARTTKI